MAERERDRYVYEYELRSTVGDAINSTGRLTQTAPVREGDLIGLASTFVRVERVNLGPSDTDGRLSLRTLG
jgi:hypothetical protein